MRNPDNLVKVVHDYFDVDLDVLWQVIKQDIPTLKKQLKPLVK